LTTYVYPKALSRWVAREKPTAPSLPPLTRRRGGGLASIRMRKKATFDSNRKARSEAPPPHFLYRVSQPKMSSHLNEDAVKREPFDTAGRLEKDSLLLLVLFLKNSYKKFILLNL